MRKHANLTKNEFQPSPVGAGTLAVWCYVLRFASSTFPEPAISRDHPGQNSLAVITKRIKVRGGHVPSVLRDRLWALSRHPADWRAPRLPHLRTGYAPGYEAGRPLWAQLVLAI